MSLRFERVLTFGPVVNYSDKETWTEEVKGLYERLKKADVTALAPLLAIDLEFICDRHALAVLIILKYAPDTDEAVAKRELRMIANVLTRRPVKRGYLPPGDLLHGEVAGLTVWLRGHQLLRLKKESSALEKRLRELLTPKNKKRETLPDGVLAVGVGWEGEDGEFRWHTHEDSPSLGVKDSKEIDRICNAFLQGVRPFGRYLRSERSWALETLAILYDTDRKLIEKRISRDEIVRSIKALSRPKKKSR